jgi:predicted TPR repeat methyltransferase
MAADDEPIDDWLVQGTSDPGEAAHRYDEWAESYDADLDSWDYRAPGVVAETAIDRKPDARSVLDVGCGTGLVGRALRAKGFKGRLEGLDISESSLRIAEQTGAYDELKPADLQQPLEVSDRSVDVLVCVGVMTYLPDVEATWREFARVVRPGGLVVVTMREDLWETRSCPDVIERLQSDGVWTPADVTGPAPYMPEATGDLADVDAYYLTAVVT